jgi:hypothetical protein
MPAIKVTIGDMPLLLRSLVEGILAGDPQFELLGGDEPDAPRDDGADGFDVLVISESAMRRVLPHPRTLEANGELGIVAISADGHDAAVMRLNSHRQSLAEGPRQSLSQAIRDAAGVAREPH